MPEAATAVRTEAEFQVVSIDQVQESKTNPRKHFAKDALSDLTKSIAEKGILVPLLVRPLAEAGTSATKRVAAMGGGIFEILAGARRLRAAKAAGLKQVPILIRELDDEQALEVQVIENLQREDIHPLEEAEGYKQLLAKGKYDVEALAAKVGKSVRYIYARMQLAECIPTVKQAFEEEKITAGHAILLARLQPKDQAEALKEASYRQGEVCSVRELSSWIHENIHLELKAAPWDLDDKQLLAGAGSCKECPKRSGANPELFPDVKTKDTCTDPSCFDQKMHNHLVQIQAQLEKEGKRVVLISMADSYGYGRKKAEGVLSTKDWKLAETNQECDGLAIGLVVEGGWHRKEYRRGAQVRICTNQKCKIHWGESSGSTYRRPESEKRRERARKLELERRGRIFRAMVETGKTSVSQNEERAILAWVIRQVDSDHARQMCYALKIDPPVKHGFRDFRGALETRTKKIGAQAVSAWLLYAVTAARDLFYGAYLSSAPKSQLLDSAAKARGVNIAKITKGLREEKAKKKAKGKAKAKKPAKSQTPAKPKKAKKKAA